MLPSLCKIETIFAISFDSIYGAVSCLQLTKLSCDDCENVYFILLTSNRKYESLTIV